MVRIASLKGWKKCQKIWNFSIFFPIFLLVYLSDGDEQELPILFSRRYVVWVKIIKKNYVRDFWVIAGQVQNLGSKPKANEANSGVLRSHFQTLSLYKKFFHSVFFEMYIILLLLPISASVLFEKNGKIPAYDSDNIDPFFKLPQIFVNCNTPRAL